MFIAVKEHLAISFQDLIPKEIQTISMYVSLCIEIVSHTGKT